MTKNKTILSQNWSFSAKHSQKKRKKNSKKFEFKAKTGAKMTKNKTVLSQNWSFRAKNSKEKKISKIDLKKSLIPKGISGKFDFIAEIGVKRAQKYGKI